MSIRATILAGLLLAGCQSVGAIRESEPVGTAEARADWKEMLACFTEKQQPFGFLLTPVVRERERRAMLMTLMPGMAPTPMWEITFIGRDDGTTLLQHRTTLKSIWGDLYGLGNFSKWATECEAEERS
jgi:hypothetical protein